MRKKKTKIWHSLWLIVPGIMVLPPLGIFALWKSPHKLWAKIAITVVCGLLAAGIWTVNIRQKIESMQIPACGYDIDKDSRNRYQNPRIYPLEGQVFSAVIGEMRSIHKKQEVIQDEIVSVDAVQPESGAFEIVADEFGLDYDVVESIYNKVSGQLAIPEKKR